VPALSFTRRILISQAEPNCPPHPSRGTMTMTNKDSSTANRLRDQRGNKLLKYRHMGHIVLALLGGFFVVVTIHWKLVIFSSSSRRQVNYHGDDLLATLPLLSSPSTVSSYSSSLMPAVKEQNVTTTTNDILLSIRPSKPVTIAYAISLIRVSIPVYCPYSIRFFHSISEQEFV
jgi:hypothetical protein